MKEEFSRKLKSIFVHSYSFVFNPCLIYLKFFLKIIMLDKNRSFRTSLRTKAKIKVLLEKRKSCPFYKSCIFLNPSSNLNCSSALHAHMKTHNCTYIDPWLRHFLNGLLKVNFSWSHILFTQSTAVSSEDEYFSSHDASFQVQSTCDWVSVLHFTQLVTMSVTVPNWMSAF